MKPRRRARTLARGLVYDEATRTAKISIYVEGRKGATRIRRTVHDVSKDEAMQVHASFARKRIAAARSLRPSHPRCRRSSTPTSS